MNHAPDTLPEALRSLAARADALAAALEPPLSAAGDVPRPEHPRPQLWRPSWLNLNGPWQFEIDRSDTGIERGLRERELAGTITVPFVPESELSGIGDTDFLEAVWYRREIEIPADWEGLRPLLHFGAVDHDATVWADGVEVARHRGGFTPFTADLSDVAAPGSTVVVVVRARDPRDAAQARGKQATWFANTHCHYTRTTGIWQTVWLEGVPETSIRSLRVLPSLAGSSFGIDVSLSANRPGTRVEIEARRVEPGAAAEDAEPITASVRADLDLSPYQDLALPEDGAHLWAPGDPQLYSLVVRLTDAEGAVLDEVRSYAGLRSSTLHGRELRINGEPVFQRLVLDQGYWPESLMTAPSDAAMVRDIRIALEAGFNGARLHQKVFEERMLFWADVHGYLTWGEFGDWGVSGRGPLGHNQQPTASFVAQWVEAVRRDLNHPSIVGWCPLNETHQVLHDAITVLHDAITVLDDVTAAMYHATKLADPSRPVLDASGYSHRVRGADVYDSHSYEQDPEAFRAEQAGLADGRPFVNRVEMPPTTMPHADGTVSVAYAGQPYFVSEYGGIWWNEAEAAAAREERAAAEDAARAQSQKLGTDQAESWGYGERVADEEAVYARFEGLTRVLLEDPEMFGYCYTQLTDVFQEKNGIVDFARGRKLDLARLRAVQEQAAAYEQRE